MVRAGGAVLRARGRGDARQSVRGACERIGSRRGKMFLPPTTPAPRKANAATSTMTAGRRCPRGRAAPAAQGAQVARRLPAPCKRRGRAGREGDVARVPPSRRSQGGVGRGRLLPPGRRCQQHEGEDVIYEGGGERRLPRHRVEHLGVAQQLDGDAHRRRRQRATRSEAVGVPGGEAASRSRGPQFRSMSSGGADGADFSGRFGRNHGTTVLC